MKTIILNLLKNFFFIGVTKKNQTETAKSTASDQDEIARYNEYLHYYQQATRWQSVVHK